MKRKTKTKYVVRNQERLNVGFYDGYDPDFLLNKASTLHFIITHRKEFEEFVLRAGGSLEEPLDRYYTSLGAEIHFSVFHQYESLFALLVAEFQDLPHWLYLSSYETRDIRKKVKEFLDGDITALTGGAVAEARAFVRRAVYSIGNASPDENGKKLERSVENVLWILEKVGDEYSKGEEYNAYKHGVRVFHGSPALSLGSKDDGSQILNMKSAYGITFLKLKDVGEGGQTAYECTRFINPEVSVAWLSLMNLILVTVKQTRLAALKKSPTLTVQLIEKMDREALLSRVEVGQFEITI